MQAKYKIALALPGSAGDFGPDDLSWSFFALLSTIDLKLLTVERPKDGASVEARQKAARATYEALVAAGAPEQAGLRRRSQPASDSGSRADLFEPPCALTSNDKWR